MDKSSLSTTNPLPLSQRIPLDIWHLILLLLPPHLCWPLRPTSRAFKALIEDHIAPRWFRHACVEVKWAPYFRIFDSPSLGGVRDPYPVRRVKGGWVGFERPETWELESGAWSYPGKGDVGGHWPGAGRERERRRANLTKSLWLHKEVTVSLALGGEVSQPMKLRLKILPSNDDPDDLTLALSATSHSCTSAPSLGTDLPERGEGKGDSRGSSMSPSPSPSPPESGSESRPGSANGRGKTPNGTMYLSANGRRIRLDWRKLLDGACRQGKWSALAR